MKQLTSMKAVYDALGGVERIAAITRARPQQVKFWLWADKLPAHTYVAMTIELEDKGYEARPSLWAMKGRVRRRRNTVLREEIGQ